MTSLVLSSKRKEKLRLRASFIYLVVPRKKMCLVVVSSSRQVTVTTTLLHMDDTHSETEEENRFSVTEIKSEDGDPVLGRAVCFE